MSAYAWQERTKGGTNASIVQLAGPRGFFERLRVPRPGKRLATQGFHADDSSVPNNLHLLYGKIVKAMRD
ncbi:MAG: hypothetical protein J6333_00275 [Planctomycetes bacterium]|nr:hypothetical protein [Planctomycetota bacterium]